MDRFCNRASSALSGGGKVWELLKTLTRQVEHLPLPPQTAAWGILAERLAASTVVPMGTETEAPPLYKTRAVSFIAMSFQFEELAIVEYGYF
jgi:hypothetical protein